MAETVAVNKLLDAPPTLDLDVQGTKWWFAMDGAPAVASHRALIFGCSPNMDGENLMEKPY